MSDPAHHIPRVLSIAGTDPSGGAGIHADLKSIAANGGYGMAAVTALVAQNTMGVRAIHMPPAAFLTAQLRSVSDDVTIDAVKIGMLFDAPTIDVVHRWLSRVAPPLVVLDPVMVATSGDRLLDTRATHALRRLLPCADLVTPNVAELGALLQVPPARTWDDVVEQTRSLATAHNIRVLTTGGHMAGQHATDVLISPAGPMTQFAVPRIDTSHTHGTGCSLSAAIATRRAVTNTWEEAIGAAKAWLTESIAAAEQLDVGRGHGPVSHFTSLWRKAARAPLMTPGGSSP